MEQTRMVKPLVMEKQHRTTRYVKSEPSLSLCKYLVFTYQASRNSTPMVMLEMGSPLETPLHSSSKTGSVKMKTLRNLSEIHARLSQHPVHQLSLGQAGVGVVAVLGQLLVSLCNDVHLQLATMGEGFFCGLVFVTVGGLGVFTAGRATRFTVRWANILI